MKLVDKMLLFSRILRDNTEDRKFHLDTWINKQKAHFRSQAKYWRDQSLYDELDDISTEIRKLSFRYNDVLHSINKKTNELLRKEELVLLRKDYDTFATEKRNLELTQERALRDKDIIKEISNEVGYYSDWHYAGCELNPSNGILTESMLACDPLYLYTGNITDTDSIRSKFNSFFADKRLMIYDDLDKLPQGQLGLATSINCYEFWPIDPIKDEMRKVYNILRPGGYFIFTYNDCEKIASLELCAGNAGYRAYNTRTLMASMVEMLGFDIVKEQSFREANSWMVVKKPGELISQKLSAPLVTIETPLKSV
jgi:hypothetical protein